jgi:hypothetical protein
VWGLSLGGWGGGRGGETHGGELVADGLHLYVGWVGGWVVVGVGVVVCDLKMCMWDGWEGRV